MIGLATLVGGGIQLGKALGVGKGGLKKLFKKGGIKDAIRTKGRSLKGNLTALQIDKAATEAATERRKAVQQSDEEFIDQATGKIDKILGDATKSSRTLGFDMKQLGIIGAVIVVLILILKK